MAALLQQCSFLIILTLGCFPWTTANTANLAKMIPGVNLPPMALQMLKGANIENKIESIMARMKDPVCAAHLRAIAEGIKQQEFWALSMLDASSKFPDGVLEFVSWQFGNYEQCLRIRDVQTASGSFSGKYCMVRLCVSDSEECIDDIFGTMSKGVELLGDLKKGTLVMDNLYEEIKGVVNTSVYRVGACVPSTCDPKDISSFFNGIFSQTIKDIHTNVAAYDCHEAETTQYTFIDNFTVALFTFMLAVIVASTVYDLTHENSSSRNEVYVAFSAYTNLKKLMSTSESNDTQLRCLHGIRFLSISYVVLGHTYLMSTTEVAQNIVSAGDFMRSKSCMWIMAGVFSVDTFFLLSGLLLSYIFLNIVTERGSMNFKAFYIHRFVRLTPALASVLLFEYSLAKKLGNGPYWHQHYQDDCDKGNWWSVLFYYKNWNTISSCMIHTWYLAVDTQLYCLSPIFLVALWKRPRLGLKMLGVGLFVSWICPLIQAYLWKCRIPVRPVIFIGDGDMKSTIHLYVGTENRFGPWIIGMGLGYIIHKLRSGQLTIKMSKMLVTIMWIYIIATILMSVRAIYPYMQIDHVYNRFWDSLYNSVCHLFWASAIFLLIFACVTGYAGPINWLLSLHLWVPVSRLTYAIYLIHMTVLVMVLSTVRTSTIFSQHEMIRKFFSHMILNFLAATVINLMFESPLVAVEKVLMKKYSPAPPVKNTKDIPDHEEKLLVNGEFANVVVGPIRKQFSSLS